MGDEKNRRSGQAQARTRIWVRMPVLDQLGLGVADQLLDQPRVLQIHVGAELVAHREGLADEEVTVDAPVH